MSEDREFLAINKPAGLVCHPTKGDEFSSLISRARLYLGLDSAPHLVNRLDRETSGVVIVAKTVDAASGLRKLWASREVYKVYQAIVHGHPPSGAFTINAPLGKDLGSEVAIKDSVVKEGSPAITHVSVLKRFYISGKPFSWLRVRPVTGRKHQIRIHLSYAGHPIVGDKLYGSDERLYLAFVRSELTGEQRDLLITENHSLHASMVTFPWQGTLRTYRCEPEKWFQDLLRT